MADSVLVQQKPTPKPRRSKNAATGNNNAEENTSFMQISQNISDSTSSSESTNSQILMNGSTLSSLGGDIIDEELAHPNEPENVSPILNQCENRDGESVAPVRRLSESVSYILNTFENITPAVPVVSPASRPTSLFAEVQNGIGVLAPNSPASPRADPHQQQNRLKPEVAYENPEYAEVGMICRDHQRPIQLTDNGSPSPGNSNNINRKSNLIWWDPDPPSEFLKKANFDRLYPDLTNILETPDDESLSPTAANAGGSGRNSKMAATAAADYEIISRPISNGRAFVDGTPASVGSYYSDSTIRLSSYSSQRLSENQSAFDQDLANDESPVFDGGRLVLDTSPMPSKRLAPNKDNAESASSGNEDSKSSRESVHSNVVPQRPPRVEPRNAPSIVVKPHRQTSASNHPVSSNVCYVGWLTKLAPKKKDNLRRWSVLNNGNLSFFLNDETTDKALENIPCKNIVFITVESQCAYSKDSQLNDLCSQYLFGIFYSKTSSGGKLEHVTYSVDTADERAIWVTLLAKIVIPGETAELYERIDRAGLVYLKKGTTAEWEKGWMLMVGYSILYSCESDKCSFMLDSRKIMRLRTVDDVTDHCPLIKSGAGNGYPFVITTEGSALYVQNGNNVITETWKTGIESILTQRTSVLMDQRLNFDDVPVLVEKCINFIAVHGMNIEGIHRLSGTSSKIRVLFEEFQKDPYAVHLRLDDYSVNDVASVLRKFFRQLREPLVTAKLRPNFIDKSCKPRISETGTRRVEYKRLLHELPNVNYRTLRKMLGHLKSVSDNCHENKMSVQNLAAIFGPTLFSVDRDAVEGINFTNTSQAINSIAEMILYYNWLFDVGESEAQKEAEIQQKVNDLRDFPKKPLAGNLLLPIYTVQKDGVSFNMQITNNLFPSDVCDFAVSGRKINALRQEVALFEVICNGELQRLILPDEKVLGVVSRWTSWPLEERANNFLIVKLDFVTDRVKSIASAQTLFPSCEVQFSDSKSFKKSLFQFTQCVIVQYKDSKAKNKVNEWVAENLLWYFGCETKRQPPTRYCLTFLTKDDCVKRSKSLPFFGKTLCFKDEVDMYKWLCTVLLINESFLSKNDF